MSNEISPFKQSAVSEGMPASPPSTYPFRKISLLRRQSYSAAELHSIPINPALTPADQARRSGRIDAQLTKEAKERQKAVRYEVVLLGPGDSGKTTFLRQVTIFYGVAFTQDEYQDYKWGIIRNIRKNFLTLYLALELTGNLEKYLHEHAAYEVKFSNGRSACQKCRQ